MIENGCLISNDNNVLYWHLPTGRDAGSLPDSLDLWDVMWQNRDAVLGFAHSHPGTGLPGPSFTDVTTFSAVERAFGRKLDWWITSRDSLIVARWNGPGKFNYKLEVVDEVPGWIHQLREISYKENSHE